MIEWCLFVTAAMVILTAGYRIIRAGQDRNTKKDPMI
jgi:hypothetical protein